jgi:hypothetical protein
MGGGDWNDGMNRVGMDGRGESVWLGWFLHDTLKRFASLVKLMKGDPTPYLQKAEKLSRRSKPMPGMATGTCALSMMMVRVWGRTKITSARSIRSRNHGRSYRARQIQRGEQKQWNPSTGCW